MATKEVKKKTAVRKTAKTKTVSTDPFDAVAEPVVESAAPKKRAIKIIKAEAIAEKARERVSEAASELARVKLAKKAAMDAIEPFADVVAGRLSSSPVKKRAVKSANKVVETVETTAKPAKKASVKKSVKKTVKSKKADLDVTTEIAATEPEVELSPAFKALADVKLPELTRENRARLLMQSPTKLYFYWSVKDNPWHQLKNVFGDDLGGYVLALKLKNLTRDSEEIHQCEAEGNWWFDAEPDCEYEAEVGFYAVNRPYFRVIYSNAITTPRRSPSTRPATDSQWTVSATKFAEVLDASGFSRDAVDVALAGDDQVAAADVAHVAFVNFIGDRDAKLDGVTAEDIRYAMLAIASGFTLEELRWKVSSALFAVLQANAGKLSSSNAQSSLAEHFEIHETEWTEEEFSSAVYGASLVHFPKQLKTKKLSPKTSHSPRLHPVSSHSIG